MDQPFLRSVIKNNLTFIQVMAAFFAYESGRWRVTQGNGDIILWDFENKTRRGPMLKMPSAVNALIINLASWRRDETGKPNRFLKTIEGWN